MGGLRSGRHSCGGCVCVSGDGGRVVSDPSFSEDLVQLQVVFLSRF